MNTYRTIIFMHIKECNEKEVTFEIEPFIFNDASNAQFVNINAKNENEAKQAAIQYVTNELKNMGKTKNPKQNVKIEIIDNTDENKIHIH